MGRAISNEQVMRVGSEVASMWGAVVLSFVIDFNKKDKEITYICKEDDEEFITTISIHELIARTK
jgi:uncharacterized protein YbcV (DUF1398 family)